MSNMECEERRERERDRDRDRNRERENCSCNKHNKCHEEQEHVHELQGSTFVSGGCNECHNHRFATVTGEKIGTGGSSGNHVHEVKFRTDFYDEHYHEFCGRTTVGINVGDGRHVHFIKDCTEEQDGHIHGFRAATLIDNPIEHHCED